MFTRNTYAKYALCGLFAYGGSYLCRVDSGELWCMVGDMRFVYVWGGVRMRSGMSLKIVNTRLAPRDPGKGLTNQLFT